jgi:gallate dioxygenase
MARIIGGIATSHSPTIAFAQDAHKENDPAWAPIFEGFGPVKKWLAEKKPDVLFYIYNDHITSIFFDHYSHFALGIGEEYPPADEGGGVRHIPTIKGHPKLAEHIAFGLVADEFDLSYFQGKGMDHGAFSPLSMMMKHEGEWEYPIVPLQVGVLEVPVPSAKRCYKLGQSLRKAIMSYPEDLKVVIVSTGGLSHQVHGERSGYNNEPWDRQFLDMITDDPVRLSEITIADYVRLGGQEGAEVIMWLIMRGALSANVKKVHQSYYLPTMTGLATLVLEDQSIDPPADTLDAIRDHMLAQYKGIDKLEGNYPYTVSRMAKSFRVNTFLHALIKPEHRRRFKEDLEGLFTEWKLTEEERKMIRNHEWQNMIHYGVCFFMLEKMGAVIGTSNLHIYAAMAGKPIEEFLKTRNAPGALYSVAAEVPKKFTTAEDSQHDVPEAVVAK